MQTPEITAYLKTYCGWSGGVRAVLAKYNLPYTEKDIIQNPAFRWEMETKSGQPLSPSVEINGHMLADISGEQVERYLIDNKLVHQRSLRKRTTRGRSEAKSIGRLTHSLPLARSRDLPVYVARLPPAPFCELRTLSELRRSPYTFCRLKPAFTFAQRNARLGCLLL